MELAFALFSLVLMVVGGFYAGRYIMSETGASQLSTKLQIISIAAGYGFMKIVILLLQLILAFVLMVL